MARTSWEVAWRSRVRRLPKATVATCDSAGADPVAMSDERAEHAPASTRTTGRSAAPSARAGRSGRTGTRLTT